MVVLSVVVLALVLALVVVFLAALLALDAALLFFLLAALLVLLAAPLVLLAAPLVLLAALEAWQQSGWVASENLPAVFGTTSGGMQLGEDYYRQAVRVNDRRKQATRTLYYQPQVQALNVMEALGCRGPVTVIANACASGANAVGHAWELIRSGF